MDRFIRFSGTGAHLLWRMKNGAKCVPFKTLDVLKDGSELVLLRESGDMRSRRRKAAGDPALPSLPDTIARLVCFTVLTRTRGGRVKTAQIRLLTTLLDPGLTPPASSRSCTRKMADRSRVPSPEKDHPRHRPRPARALGGPGPPGSLGTAARAQHDRRPAARAAATAGLDPGQIIPFTAVLALARPPPPPTPAAPTAESARPARTRPSPD